MPNLCHKDTITIVDTTDSTEYGNKKVVAAQYDVKATFLQDTGFLHSNNQDAIDSDAIVYLDHKNSFVVANHNRLEGMCVVAPLYDGEVDNSWYKIIRLVVNRDHLLGNKIDNIQCLLKKTDSLPGVS